ncbi:MAG: glycosyltransferase [Thermodesulfobacteriota bacterium]
MNGKSLRIIVFHDSAGLIDPECTAAFRQMGHQVKEINLVRNPANYRVCLPFDLVERMAEIINYDPDLLFMVNGSGIDQKGLIPCVCTILKIPLVLWYVDKPFSLENWNESYITPYTVVFVFDRIYVEELRGRGISPAYHLSLATNPDRFKPFCLDQETDKKYINHLSFVGRLDIGRAAEHRAELRTLWPDMPGEIEKGIDRAVEIYSSRPFDPLADVLIECGLDRQISSAPFHVRKSIERVIELSATAFHRLNLVKATLGCGLKVWGEPDWLRFIPARHYSPEAGYFHELVKVYNGTVINVNISRPQLKSAVNQRLFDVPACRAFLLTDWREELPDYFEPGKEVACYRDEHELIEQIEYYLDHPDKRREIALAGHERVLSEHTYVHRMDRVLRILRQEFTEYTSGLNIEDVMKKDSLYAEAHNLLGAACRRLGRTEDARNYFRRACAIDPRNFDANLNLGRILADEGKKEKAEHYLHRAVSAHPEKAIAHHQLAFRYIRAQDYVMAKKVLVEALSLHPEDSLLLEDMGVLMGLKGEHQEALGYFRKAAEFAPDRVSIYVNMAVACEELSLFEEAIDAYKHILALEPEKQGFVLERIRGLLPNLERTFRDGTSA